MLLYDYTIAFQEVPDQISLVLNISECPHRCDGCHSKWLWSKKGTVLTKEIFLSLLERYDGYISCVCFMGGEWDDELREFLSVASGRGLVTCLYSGSDTISDSIIGSLDYLKTGKYVEKFGGLDSPNTNQIFMNLKENKIMNDRFMRGN